MILGTWNFNEGWPAERTARLIAMRSAGYSKSKIASALGVSRGAVSGKIHRLKAKGIL
jgi:hypothetical protein